MSGQRPPQPWFPYASETRSSRGLLMKGRRSKVNMRKARSGTCADDRLADMRGFRTEPVRGTKWHEAGSCNWRTQGGSNATPGPVFTPTGVTIRANDGNTAQLAAGIRNGENTSQVHVGCFRWYCISMGLLGTQNLSLETLLDQGKDISVRPTALRWSLNSL